MKKLVWWVGWLVLVHAWAEGAERPNVVLFLIDDLGWADLELTGSTFYETPHVDALAAAGAFFSDAYAASPVCSPTRASIQTGKDPSRMGMSYLAGSRGPMGPGHMLVPPPVVGNIPPEETTLAEALRQAGYTTAHIGKWHLQGHGERGRENYPDKHGFDVNIAGHNAGQPGSYYFPYQSPRHAWTNVPDLEEGQKGDYLTDALTDRAIRFIEAQQGKPFYLNMWYYTVHTPIQPRKDKLAKYRRKAQALGLEKTSGQAVPDHQSWTHARQDNPPYAALVESMDENIGRILEALKRLDLANDTIVIFFSDNGGLSTGGGPKMPTSNLPLRAGKAWLYEGGIRVPLIIRYPPAVKGGQRIDQPVISTDIYPTILDLAGLPLRPQQHVDGVSLKPLLSGTAAKLDRQAIYFHFPHYHHINTMGPSGAVREGDYKLIEVFETGGVELYNLRDDIGEQQNLAEARPQLAAGLKRMLHDWRAASGVQMPTRNPDYQPAQDWRKK